MSYITNIKAEFLKIYPDGTFDFDSPVFQDRDMQNIAQANFPLFLIQNTVRTEGEITEGQDNLERPKFDMLVLTKFDSLGNQIEADESYLNLETKLVEPMKDLAVQVISKYLLRYQLTEVVRYVENPNYTIENVYNWGGSGLSGVRIRINNLIVRRDVDLTDPD